MHSFIVRDRACSWLLHAWPAVAMVYGKRCWLSSILLLHLRLYPQIQLTTILQVIPIHIGHNVREWSIIIRLPRQGTVVQCCCAAPWDHAEVNDMG